MAAGHCDREATGNRGNSVSSSLEMGDDPRQYAQLFDLHLQDYELVLTDEFAEPGSEVFLRRLHVRNDGEMPTPQLPTTILLPENAWVRPTGSPLTLDQHLNNTESFGFERDSLTATVADLEQPWVGPPLRELAEVAPVARQSGVERQHPQFHLAKTFTVAFPAELSEPVSLLSQSPGQAARFLIEITNRSRQDFGIAADNGRRLQVTLTLGNQELGKDLLLFDADGSLVTWVDGWMGETPLLQSGEQTRFELVLGVLPGATGYSMAELDVTLHIGDLADPPTARPRHQRRYELRIAEPYLFDPKAEVLFIANHSTTTDERHAWESAAAQMGKPFNIWDVSLHDQLSLGGALAHGDSLLRDFHGNTIVLSNYEFDTIKGKRHGEQFLSQMDLIRALESHGMRMLVLNDEQRDATPLLRERLIPTDGEPEYRYSSIQAFLRASDSEGDALLADLKEMVERRDKAAKHNPLFRTSRIAISGIRRPNRRRLKRLAERLHRRLEVENPGKRFVVAYHLPDELENEQDDWDDDQKPAGGFFFTHELQGYLTVMPTVGDGRTNIVILPADPTALHSKSFATSNQAARGLVQAVGFRDKVYQLDALLRTLADRGDAGDRSQDAPEWETGEILVDAILADLAVEAGSLAKSGWRSPLDSTVGNGLPLLKFLASHPFTILSLQADRPEVRLAAKLLTGLRFLGGSQSRWYESRWLPWGWWRRGPLVRVEYRRQAKKLSDSFFGPTLSCPPELLKSFERAYRRDQYQLGKRHRLRKKAAGRRAMLSPLNQAGMTLDNQVSFPRVLSHEQWSHIRHAEQQRETDRLTLRNAKEQHRQQFLVVDEGQAIENSGSSNRQAATAFAQQCQLRQPRTATARHTSPQIRPEGVWTTDEETAEGEGIGEQAREER